MEEAKGGCSKGGYMQRAGKIKIEANSHEARALLLKALLRIGDQWNLSLSTLATILQRDRTRLIQWQKNGEVPSVQGATKEALQNLIAIYRSLGAIFQEPSDQLKWLKAIHPDLDRKEPLQMMQDSMQGLIEVRVYLDYVRGRGV